MRFVHDTVWPVVTFVSDGLVIGPLIVMTGRVSKFPSLVTVTLPAGVCAGSVNGNVSGTVTPNSGFGKALTVTELTCVEYLRGSGAISAMLNVTSASVGYVSVIFPDRRTAACFGTGSLYVNVARSEIGTACCSSARARSRSACVGADAVTDRVIARAA